MKKNKTFKIKDLVKVHYLGFTEDGMIVSSPRMIQKSYSTSLRYCVEKKDGKRDWVIPRIIIKRRFPLTP